MRFKPTRCATLVPLTIACLAVLATASASLAQQALPYAPLIGQSAGYEPTAQPAPASQLERLPTPALDALSPSSHVAQASTFPNSATDAVGSEYPSTFDLPASPPYETLPPATATSPATPGYEPYSPPPSCLHGCCGDDLSWYVGGKARGYYWNDQRIEFTGQEATFGVEGVIQAGADQQVGAWQMGVDTEVFLNQPFDRNILIDSPERIAFAPNYDIDLVQISQLYFSARKGDFYAAAGRFVTPFGRFYFPNYFNNFVDSPFIRSEAILFRETGGLVQWDPEPFVFTAALTNGGPERDTNSSKALISRIGVERDWFALGTSIKLQDGIGSEHQKTFNQHVGVDAMIRGGRWTLSAEAIYDEYGLRKPGLGLNDISWGRSIYYRELNNGFLEPMTGFGYYVDLGYRGLKWEWHFNYGDYFPQQQMGIAAHDEPVHRGLVHASYHFTNHFETYAIALVENQVDLDFADRIRYGSGLAFGMQFTL